MQRRYLLLVASFFIVTIFGAGCSSVASSGMASQPQATAVPPVTSESAIVVDGILLPARRALLTAPTGGQVIKVNVTPGQAVAVGDVLVRLDDAAARAALAEAQARVARARAYLEKLQAGPRAEEIQVAQATIDVARAQLAKLQRGPSPAEIAAARAEVAEARAVLEKLKQGPNPYDIAAAKAELANARAALEQAQAAYDRVKYMPDVGARPEALQLQRATNAYKTAEARLKALQQGPADADVAAAQARLDAAQARLKALQAGPAAEDIAVAKAKLNQAEAQLALTQAFPRPEDVRLAQADVAMAEAAAQQAEIALQQTELRAPFAGLVGDIRVQEGMYISPGSPLMRVGDTSAWLVQTTNLSELDVVNIRVGDSVTLSFDAIPDLEMQGRVVAIDPVGRNNNGDVLYTVYIQVDGNDERLYWGMNTAVRFRGEP